MVWQKQEAFLTSPTKPRGSTAKLLNDSLRSWMERKERTEGKIKFLAREQDKVIQKAERKIGMM